MKILLVSPELPRPSSAETRAQLSSPAAAAPAPEPMEEPNAQPMEAGTPRECPLQHLSLQQLKADKSRFEKYILKLTNEGNHALREHLEERLISTNMAIKLRKLPGQTFD